MGYIYWDDNGRWLVTGDYNYHPLGWVKAKTWMAQLHSLMLPVGVSVVSGLYIYIYIYIIECVHGLVPFCGVAIISTPIDWCTCGILLICPYSAGLSLRQRSNGMLVQWQWRGVEEYVNTFRYFTITHSKSDTGSVILGNVEYFPPIKERLKWFNDTINRITRISHKYSSYT